MPCDALPGAHPIRSATLAPAPLPVASSADFGLVVPVKPLSLAKSRLSPLGDQARRDLVVAFALDTLLAARGCCLVRSVLVVTDDAGLARTLAAVGVQAVPDGDTGDLNATLRQGAAELVRRVPAVRPVALCADLPALRAEEMTLVLQQAPRDRASFLADAAGTGTTLYTAPSLAQFEPRFGAASRRVHQEAGAVEILDVDAETVRRDVDVPDDLVAAAALGLGPRSSRAFLEHGLGQPG